MKVCKNCGEINPDGNVMCKMCTTSCKDFIDKESANVISNNNLHKQENIKKYIGYSIMISTLSIMVILFILRFSRNTLTLGHIVQSSLLLIVGGIMIKYTGEVFVLINIFKLRDLNKDLMSDMYDTYLKIVGVIMMITSIVILIPGI